MTGPVLLYNCNFQPDYVGFGNYASLIGKMHLGFGDKLVLRLQTFLPAKKPEPGSAFDRVMRSPILHSHNALLHYTGSSSDTDFIGLMEKGKETKSVRVLKQAEDMMFHIHQSQFVHGFFNGPFIMMPFAQMGETVLSSAFVPMQRLVDKSDHIIEKIVHLNDMFLTKYFRRKSAREFIPLDMKGLCVSTGNADLFDKIEKWVSRQTGTSFPIVPVHGKFTRDNLYVSNDEKIVLTDYERAGWHVPFYDYFHYVLQPLSVREKAPRLSDIKLNDIDAEKLPVLLGFYLIDQIYHDLGDYYQKNYQYTALDNAIRHKSAWLEQLLSGN